MPYIDRDTNARAVYVVSGPKDTTAGGLNEAFTLINNNVAANPVQVYGGDYVFAQQASGGYGTVRLEVLGPDGSTYQVLVSKTASDTAGGTLVTLGANAVVRGAFTGTTATYATLSRAPN